MLAVCLRLLLLLPLVCCVPSLSRPPSRLCKRCCDHTEPPAATAQYQIPEVRTVINMTILKGTRAWVNFSQLLSLEVGWYILSVWHFLSFPARLLILAGCDMGSQLRPFVCMYFRYRAFSKITVTAVARSVTKKPSILKYLCYSRPASSYISLIGSQLLLFQMVVCVARRLFNQKNNRVYCNRTVLLKCDHARIETKN